MSPSSSNSSSGNGSLRGASAGLYFGRESVSCVLVHADAAGTSVKASQTMSLATPLFKGAPQAETVAALADTITRCCAEVRGRHLPVHMVVPDAAVCAAVFELDQVPASADALGRLVEFRLGKEFGSTPGVSVTQLLGPSEGKTLVLGASLDKAWASALLSACAAAGVVPWSLTAITGAVFNGFHDSLVGTSGALISVSADAWSLWAWDAAGLARPLRTQWRNGAQDERDIAAEVERALIAYTDGHAARAIAKLHLWSPGASDALGDVLDRRVQTPCSRWGWPRPLMSAEDCARSPSLAACVVAALVA